MDNLNKMAEAAGLYLYLWRPEEVGITKASELIAPLRAGLALLERAPDFYKKFNPPNNWGNYEDLVTFVRRYIEACELHPESRVSACR